VTGIEEINNSTIPTLFNLYQNMPNPFSSQTAIRYSIPSECNVSLSIYDISGKLVKNLVDETMNKGVYAVSWNGNDNNGRKVGQGAYFYILKTAGENIQKKMLLLR
jgi:flagellar hook assembly protein FlgD